MRQETNFTIMERAKIAVPGFEEVTENHVFSDMPCSKVSKNAHKYQNPTLEDADIASNLY